MTHVGNKEILGQTFEVHADVQSGNFRIVAPAAEGETRTVSLGVSQTLAGAVAAARTELNKRRVNVAVKFRDAKGKRLTAYSLHAGNGKVLARYDDTGTAEQFDSYARSLFKPDTPDDVMERYNAIADEIAVLKTEANEIEREWRLADIGMTVKRAIDEAAKGVPA